MKKKLHLLPNEEFLHSVEDELYQYAVDHPGYTWDIFFKGTTPEFDMKMDELTWEEPYISACEKSTREMSKKFLKPMEVIEEFVEKFPQWKEIFYY